jgi:multidrug efflux pump subunit AcrA (membrane-fusion protein)
LPYLLPGAHVELTVDALPGEAFQGTLALVEPQVGRTTRAASARVVVPNADGKLRPGLFVRAAVAMPPPDATGRLLIPTDAVQSLGDEDVVFAELAPGEFEIRPVRLARRTAEVCEVASGIQRAERIAVTGSFLLRNEVTKQ